MADINSSGHTTNIVDKEKLSKLNNNCTSREHIQLGIDSRWKKKKTCPTYQNDHLNDATIPKRKINYHIREIN